MEAKQKGVFLWQLADAVGVSEMTVIRKLRRELPEEEKAQLKSIIAGLASRKGGAARG